MTTQRNHHSPLRLLTSNSVRATLSEIIPRFERDSGIAVAIVYDLADATMRRILDGEPGDAVIVNTKAMNELVAHGLVAADGHIVLAHSGVGVAVRAGAPKPDIGSVEAFRKALLDARSIAHTSAGASGLYFTRLIERLGIADEVRAKAQTRRSGIIGELVARGEAEMAIQHVPQLLEVRGLDYVGPLPRELQTVSVMAAGMLAQSPQPEAARTLLAFLGSPATADVFRALGYDVGAPLAA